MNMKILGVGIDLLDISRIANLYAKYGSRLTDKILSNEELLSFEEIDLMQKKVNFIAKRFSAKEAFLKAVGIGMGRGIGLRDMTITKNQLGQPVIVLNEVAMGFLEWFYTPTLSSLPPALSSSRMRGSHEVITTAWDPRDKPKDDRVGDEDDSLCGNKKNSGFAIDTKSLTFSISVTDQGNFVNSIATIQGNDV
ncbi:hypothetical protein FACS1894152_5540 [Bacilli bacterium]|nr:hypothetical protein FACS1894152_5540 [Bacilli bacterium]